MKTKGWVKIHRNVLTSDLYDTRPFHKALAWFDLILTACYEPETVYFNGFAYDLKPGQIVTSIRELAKRWGWSRTTVTNFIKSQTLGHRIGHEVGHRSIVISIKNWEDYQQVEPQSRPQSRPLLYKEEEVKKKEVIDKSIGLRPEDPRNENVEFLLELFEKTWGFKPTDKYPRRAAYNFVQIITSYLKKERLREPTPERIRAVLGAYVSYLKTQGWAQHIQKVETFKLKFNLFKAEVARKEERAKQNDSI